MQWKLLSSATSNGFSSCPVLFFLIESSDEDDASGDEGLLDDDSVSICGPKLSLSPQIIKLHIF